MIRKAILTALMLLVAACAGPSTTIDQVWTAPRAQGERPLHRVVTIFISNDTTMRHAGEDQLARQLAATGVQATPGYAVFGDQPTNLQNIEALKADLRNRGYDGVVTMRIVGREQEVNAVPSSFDWYWGYWGPWYYGAYSPGYVYTETIYRLESAAYSLDTGRLVWSALTKTTDPSSAHQLVGDTSQIVANQLAQRGLTGYPQVGAR
jgi:hypothetical protein